MGKLMGLILIVAVAYGGWELHSKGRDGALGGMFAANETTQQPSDDSKRKRSSRIRQMGQLGPSD